MGMKHEPMKQLTEADFTPKSNAVADSYKETAWEILKDGGNKLTFASKCFLEAAKNYDEKGQHYEASRCRKLAQSIVDAFNSIG